MVTINNFIGVAEGIDVDLKSAKESIHAPKVNLEINSKAVSSAKDAFQNAQKTQKELIKRHENDHKRYKVLKKYGEVLQLVEKLFGLIPGNLSNLSIEELEEKLEEMIKSRKKNEQQIIFTFYQNLITDILSNIITIEKNHQQGLISSAEALKDIKQVKTQFNISKSEMPATLHNVLGNSMEDAAHLINIYEQSFKAEQQLDEHKTPDSLKQTDLNLRHDVLFTKLNTDTKELLSRVDGLSSDLSNFEPHVDLDNLTECLKSTDDLLHTDNWQPDQLDSAVGKLQSTTLSLTDKQVEINASNEKLETEIKDCTEQASTLTEIPMKEISMETFKDMEARAEESTQIADDTIKILENDENLSTTIGVQVAETLSGQLEADERIGDKLVVDPNASTVFRNEEATSEALNEVADLKNHVLTVEEQKELVLQLQLKQNLENNDNDKK